MIPRDSVIHFASALTVCDGDDRSRKEIQLSTLYTLILKSLVISPITPEFILARLYYSSLKLPIQHNGRPKVESLCGCCEPIWLPRISHHEGRRMTMSITEAEKG